MTNYTNADHTKLANQGFFLDALEEFAEVPAEFERGNYADDDVFRADIRKAARDLAKVRELARMIRVSSEAYRINVYLGDYLLSHAYRLEMQKTDLTLWYCAGQYYPLEYRAACVEALRHAIRAAYVGSVQNREDWREALRCALVPAFGKANARKISNR